METTNHHTVGGPGFYGGGTESQTEASIEASIIEQLRREILEIKCDWDHRHRSETSAFYDIVRPLHTLAYGFLEVLDTEPLNVTIRQRLATVDFTLANIYRPGTTTPIGYSALPPHPKLLFQQLRRVLVESSYLDWSIETRDWREIIYASDKVREAILEKKRLTEEHIKLLSNSIQDGIESHESDERIAQIQEHIFAGDFFTKKDREEHRIQMDMIETRQKIDFQIRKYVKDLMSAHRYEEAQWSHEIFVADETQRLNLEDAAMEQKQKKEEAEDQRQKLLQNYARLEYERRKKDAVEKTKRSRASDSSTRGMSQVTPNQDVNAVQDMPIAAASSDSSWVDEMNHLAAIQYPYAKASVNNIAPYFDPATSRIGIPADYRPPGTASHHTWMDSKDPAVFNKNLFFVENGAYLEAAARPAMPFYMVAQIYNKMCFDGNLAINTLDLIEKRMYRENSFRRSTEKIKMADEVSRAALAPPTEPARMRKTCARNFHGTQNVLQETGGKPLSISCEITAEGFFDYVQNHITEASINKYYEAFLTKEYLLRSPNGHPIVSFKHYEKDFRGQLAQMADRITNQAQHMEGEYERQLFYHNHLEIASMRGLWKDAAQALNHFQKNMFQTQQLRAGVHPRQALVGSPHPLYQQPSSVYSEGSTVLQSIGDHRSSITSFTLDENMDATYDSDSLNPQEEFFPAPTFEDNKPNHEDKLRLLQALADQATRRATSPRPAVGQSLLAAAPVSVARYQQKSDVPGPEHEKVYMGNVFGWASVHNDRDLFLTITNQKYSQHLHKHQMRRKNDANQQRGSFRRNPSSPGAVGHGRKSAVACQVQDQNVIDKVLSGAAADGHKSVNTRIQTHQPSQHAQAHMPVGNIHREKQHSRRKPKFRDPSPGSHFAPLAGVGSTKPRTPSMLGQYAITAETTPEKEMHDRIVVKMPQIVVENRTQVVDMTAPASLPLLCSSSRDDSVMNSKPKVATALSNGTGMEPDGGVKLQQIAEYTVQEADTIASESSPLQCSPIRDDPVMGLKDACTAPIHEVSKKSQWVEMPMPQIAFDSSVDSALVADPTASTPSPLLGSPASDASAMQELEPKVEPSSETARLGLKALKKLKWVEMPMPQIASKSFRNGASVVDTTAPARSGVAKFSLLFYDDAKAVSAKLHYSDTKEDAVSFAVTDALHRGLNPITSPSRAAIGFSSDTLTDEEIIEAVKPLMPFLSSSDKSMETIKKALTAAADAVAEGIHPLAYLYEFIRCTTVAPPEKVTGAVTSSKPKLEATVKTPIKTAVKALRILRVAAENTSPPTKSPLSPMAPAFIPSPKARGPAMSSKRVASSPIAKAPVTTTSLQSGRFTNQSSSSLRIQEHIDSIVCAAGSPLGPQERILSRAANKLASVNSEELKLRGPFSLPAQQVRFPGTTPLNSPVKGSKAEAIAENEKRPYQTPIKGPKLRSRSVSMAGGSLRDSGMPQSSKKLSTVESHSASTAVGGVRDLIMPQQSPTPKPNDTPIPPKTAPGPVAKEDTRYYKSPTKSGLVASRVASLCGGNVGLPRVSGRSPGQARASNKPQDVETPHSGGVSKTIAATVENIKRAMQKNPEVVSLSQLIPSQYSNSSGLSVSGKVVDGQAPTGFPTAQKLPTKRKGLYSSKCAPPVSAPKGPRSNVASRNRPLRGPHAHALADFHSQQQAHGIIGPSQPPMVKSKSTFVLDVEMTDPPQADVNAPITKKHSIGLEANWATSLPQASEPDLRCDAIKRNLSECPDLTDPTWCPQRVTTPTTPPQQRLSPRVTFPTTPLGQRSSPLNVSRKDESHGFRRERAGSFSQTSPVFQNETKYGPPRLKGLAVRLPKASHSSPRSSQPPGAPSPLSPHSRLNQRERNASLKRDKFTERLRSPTKQTCSETDASCYGISTSARNTAFSP